MATGPENSAEVIRREETGSRASEGRCAINWNSLVIQAGQPYRSNLVIGLGPLTTLIGHSGIRYPLAATTQDG